LDFWFERYLFPSGIYLYFYLGNNNIFSLSGPWQAMACSAKYIIISKEKELLLVGMLGRKEIIKP
jgi:hypothetical protein